MKDRLLRETSTQFKIIAVLGKGAFAKVLECVNLSTHKSVALKIIKKYKLTEKQILFSIQESELLSRLDHPNIVKYIALHHTDSFLILEMELLKGKSLADLLSTKTLEESEAATIMKMIFRGVSYLHRVQVLHRDLKPDNIMFKDSDIHNLKITDFGLSTKYTLEERLDARFGTVAYMAPEQVLQKQYSEPVDIWSCGIILYQVLTNLHPIAASKEDSHTYIKSLQHIDWKFPENFPKLAEDLFLRCTRINALERYTANLALQHPWITRRPGQIPLTPLEEVRLYQDKLKLKKLLMAAVQLSGIVPCKSLVDRYVGRVNDPHNPEREQKSRLEIQPKKMPSMGFLDIGSGEKPLRALRQPSFGSQLTVPSKKALPSTSPRSMAHKRANSRILSRSPSPCPQPTLPKTANKLVRHNFGMH